MQYSVYPKQHMIGHGLCQNQESVMHFHVLVLISYPYFKS